MFGLVVGGENLGPDQPGKTWARCLTRRHRVDHGRRGIVSIGGNVLTGVRVRDGNMAHGGYKDCRVVRGGRQSGEWFYGDVAQCRGRKLLGTACNRNRPEEGGEEARRETGR